MEQPQSQANGWFCFCLGLSAFFESETVRRQLRAGERGWSEGVSVCAASLGVRGRTTYSSVNPGADLCSGR